MSREPEAPSTDLVPQAAPNYTVEALRNRWNLGALAAGLGLSLVTLSPVPLILAAGAELVYLGTVPGMRRYRRLVDSRYWHRRRLAARAEEQSTYKGLSPNQQATFDGLKELRDRIRENYIRLGGGNQILTTQSLDKIEQLLSSFLRLLEQLNAYRRYLSATDRGRIERELKALETEIGQDESVRLREIKSRRHDILGRRLERFARGEENREIISHQLAAIEDLLRLIHEQSLTVRDPQDVSRQLDTLAVEVAETEDTVREMESFLALQDEIESVLSSET